MPDLIFDPLETILRQCAGAAPAPWYPSTYARAQGIPRDDLDPALERLRMTGLIRLTEWVKDHGQGYVLTPEGTRVLDDPRDMARLRNGTLSVKAVTPADPGAIQSREMSAWDRGEIIRSAVMSWSPPVVSMALLAINVVWFVVGLSVALRENIPLEKYLMTNAEPVLRLTGALSVEDLLQGKWWRLITCCFVHIGIIHLGVNMYSLYAVGPFFEQLWGRFRFLVIYLIAGLGGSCAMAISFQPGDVGAGASGALWGILASFAVWVILNRRFLPGPIVRQWLRQIVIVLGFNIFITYSIREISAAAHFGGGAVGAIAAILLNYQRFGSLWQRWLGLVGILILPVLCVGTVATVLSARAEFLSWRHRLPQAEQLFKEALRIKATQVVAILRHDEGAKMRIDEKKLDTARQALSLAQEKLKSAAEKLQSVGPYWSPGLEDTRLQVLSTIHQKQEEFQFYELREFHFGPIMEEAGYALHFRAMPTLAQMPAQRDQASVESITALLDKLGSQLADLVETLRGAGPFRDKELESKRQQYLVLAEDESKQFSNASRCLKQGTAWKMELGTQSVPEGK